MASINDFGGPGQTLAAPPLGGTGGWADAVAAALDRDDTTVDTRIAALSAQIVGGRSRRWLWAGQDADVDPGPGGLAIEQVGSGSNATWWVARSDFDADGVAAPAGIIIPGDAFAVTDDPTSPPITQLVRYVALSDPVDMGTWWRWQADQLQVVGASVPVLGASVRMTFSVGSGVASPVTQVTHPLTDDVHAQVWDAGKARWQTAHYDTGWRNIAALLDPAWALAASAGYVLIRRIGMTVYCAGRIQSVSATTALNAYRKVLTYPAGFQPAAGYVYQGTVYHSSTTPPGLVGNLSVPTNMGLQFPGAAGNWVASAAIGFNATWSVNETAPPTTLPGTLVSAAPA